MNIITSLHIYNYHLVISYLGGGVKIIPFQGSKNNFLKRKIYHKTINIQKSVQKIETQRNVLYGLADSKVKSISLDENNLDFMNNNFWDDFTTNNIVITPSDKLIILCENKGIQQVNIKNPMSPQKIRCIIPESFEKIATPAFSSMSNQDKSILLSIRGYGVSQIENYSSEKFIENIYRTEDAQDVCFQEKRDFVVVADGCDGLIFFRNKEKRQFKKINLPESDFPQQIKSFNEKILIKGQKGLYLLNPNDLKLKKIFDGRIGAITTYYNYIFFSSKGHIHLLANTENILNSFELINEMELIVEKNEYLR